MKWKYRANEKKKLLKNKWINGWKEKKQWNEKRIK